MRAQTAAAVRLGHRLLIVGGDCPILIGALAGCADAAGTPPGLLFVDGHEDAWPPHASTTGEAADMELGLLLGPVDRWTWSPRSGRRSPGSILRAWSSSAPAIGRSSTTPAWNRSKAPCRCSTTPPCGRIRQALPPKRCAGSPRAESGWWLHVDLDVLSSEALPAVDYRQDGGLSWSDLTALTRSAISAGGCLGATVTIFNPDLDPDGRYALAIVEFIGGLADGLETKA